MRLVHWILFALAVLGTVIAVYGARSANAEWPATRIAGVCLLLLVLSWIVLARIQLGRAFSVTAQARQLVTTGLYKRIRNPIYLASPFLLIGLALAVARWWPLLLLILVIPLQIVRARREEAVLRAAFGSEYDEYRSRTWL
jgi:protein-S-isoprenylcysteine O-methyltransferase Ste14